jgi:hypothetical protein
VNKGDNGNDGGCGGDDDDDNDEEQVVSRMMTQILNIITAKMMIDRIMVTKMIIVMPQ